MNTTLHIPSDIQNVIHLLQMHNAEAFLVGGCVRDTIMGRVPHDYDIATNAVVSQIMQWFDEKGYRILAFGKRYGTICVYTKAMAVEITTYRIEKDYDNHRAPTHVVFSSSLQEDLKRRDFTMNAIAYDLEKGYMDPFCGIQDIKKGCIRCVGDPMKRFDEDALRILRALRFACELHFYIEEQTWQAIQLHAMDLRFVSVERIRDEWNRLVMGEHMNTLQLLRDSAVLVQIIPEMAEIFDYPQHTPWHSYDVFRHTDVALNHTTGYSIHAKLAIIFHDIGKVRCVSYDTKGIVHFKGHAHVSAQIAKQWMQRFHYSKADIQHVVTLIAYHDNYLHPKRNILARYLAKFDQDIGLALEVLDVQIADNAAKNPARSSELNDNINVCKCVIMQMVKEHAVLSFKDLAVNGHDMIALGYQGKDIKAVLQYLYEQVLEDPSCNTIQCLYQCAMDYRHANKS